ncbi:MAG: heavy metal translocating P-type ATPase [Pseudomonadota bacterium]
MIVEVLTMSGIYGIGYDVWRRQKRKYRSQLLGQQLQRSQILKEASDQGENQDIAQTIKKTGATKKSSTDFGFLIAATSLSSVGYLLYQPLIYLTPALVFYATRGRFRAAWREACQGRVSVQTMVSLSIIGAMLGQRFFIGSLLSLTNAIGDRLTAKVIDDSHHQLIDLYQKMPEQVWLLKDDNEISTSLSQVRKGDVLVVHAGEIIPADGHIVWGSAGIDQQSFTGEAIPVEKHEGDEIYAMTLVLSGKLHFKVEKAGHETGAMKIADILNHTADYKSATVLEAQALSHQLVKPTLVASGLTFPVFGFSGAIGILIAHPKERLQLSAPISLMRYLKQAMSEGMLIKDGRSLELLHQVDTIVFDKTGTLTEEQPKVGKIHRLAQLKQNDILRLAAVAEHKQTHPLAQAIRFAAEEQGIVYAQPEHSECHLGYGIKVSYQAQTIRVGSLRFMVSEKVELPENVQQLQENAQVSGYGLIFVSLDQSLVGAIELLPTIRSEAKEIIRDLQQLKNIKRTYIVSGDAEAPTKSLADELGISHYFAQTLPEQKAGIIQDLQQEGAFVCFIGDGINDAIAMKQAQISISLSGATQLATDTAQVLLLDQGICHLPRLFELAEGFNHHMKRQLTIILGPSIFGVSMICLAGWGMSAMMVLNILQLGTTIGYSLIEQPQRKN